MSHGQPFAFPSVAFQNADATQRFAWCHRSPGPSNFSIAPGPNSSATAQAWCEFEDFMSFQNNNKREFTATELSPSHLLSRSLLLAAIEEHRDEDEDAEQTSNIVPLLLEKKFSSLSAAPPKKVSLPRRLPLDRCVHEIHGDSRAMACRTSPCGRFVALGFAEGLSICDTDIIFDPDHYQLENQHKDDDDDENCDDDNGSARKKEAIRRRRPRPSMLGDVLDEEIDEENQSSRDRARALVTRGVDEGRNHYGFALLDCDWSTTTDQVPFIVACGWSNTLSVGRLREEVGIFPSRYTFSRLDLGHSADDSRAFRIENFAMFAVAVLPFSNLVVCGTTLSAGDVYAVDVSANRVVHHSSMAGRSNIRMMDCNAVAAVDANVFVAGGDDGIVRITDLRCWTRSGGSSFENIPYGARAVQGVLQGHCCGITGLHCPGTNGNMSNYVASNSKDQTCKVWDLRNMTSLHQVPAAGNTNSKAVVPPQQHGSSSPAQPPPPPRPRFSWQVVSSAAASAAASLERVANRLRAVQPADSDDTEDDTDDDDDDADDGHENDEEREESNETLSGLQQVQDRVFQQMVRWDYRAHPRGAPSRRFLPFDNSSLTLHTSHLPPAVFDPHSPPPELLSKLAQPAVLSLSRSFGSSHARPSLLEGPMASSLCFPCDAPSVQNASHSVALTLLRCRFNPANPRFLAVGNLATGPVVYDVVRGCVAGSDQSLGRFNRGDQTELMYEGMERERPLSSTRFVTESVQIYDAATRDVCWKQDGTAMLVACTHGVQRVLKPSDAVSLYSSKKQWSGAMPKPAMSIFSV